ncbi:hypothetical protein [Viscerimonas tarda]
MKKNYKKFMLASVLLVGSLAATAQGDPAIVLKNFASADVSSGVLYSNEGNGITVSVTGGSINAQSGAVACLSINGAFNALTLSAGGTITIVNNGSYVISEVDFSGSSLAANAGFPIVAVSLTGTNDADFLGNLFSENVGMPAAGNAGIHKVLSFPASQPSACSVAAYLIPETAYQGAAPITPKTEIDNLDTKVKAIRLKWATSGNFASTAFQAASSNSAPNIFGIKIYLKELSTGVREVKEAVGKVELSSSFIDLTGKPAKETAKGLLIKRTVYDDGSVGYAKVLR